MGIHRTQTVEGNENLQCADTFPDKPCKTETTFRCFFATGKNEMESKFVDKGIVSFKKGTKEKCITATQDVIKNAPDLYMRLYNNEGGNFEYKIEFDLGKKHTGSEITFKTLEARPKEGDSVFIENESGVQIPIGIFTNIQKSKSNGYIVTAVIQNGLENKNKNKNEL